MASRIITLLFSLILALAGIGCRRDSSGGNSNPPQLQKVKIASGGHLVHFLPLDVAVALKFFQEEGLDPEITQTSGGTARAQALIAGQIDFSLNGVDHAFKAAVQGKDNLRMVALLNRTPGMVLVVDSRLRDKIKTIADLKGQPLGVTSKGSASHMVLASLLSKSGVKPSDVSIVNADAPVFPAALQNQQIVGGIALEPFASTLVEEGKAFVLADLNTIKGTEQFFGGPYNLTGIVTRQDIIDNQPDLVRKVVNVHLRALKWIESHSEQEIADALPPEVVGSDRERYIKTLTKLKEFYSPDGYINPQGVKNVYDSMIASESIPAEPPLNLDQFFTNRFVEKASGASAGQPVKKN
jgi:NitT/TauT family transport system substrate-binding protein